MTDVKLLAAPSTHTVILQNVKRMQRARNSLEVRQTALNRSVLKMERRLALSDDTEEMQNLQDILDNLASMMNDLELFRSNLEKEVTKVRAGLADLETLPQGAGATALTNYIAADTDLSIDNLSQVSTYYDQVLETVRSINDEPLNY